MKIPDFSVIIPAHNEEDYISQTIESILNQTEQSFEIIIVLDNCTDNTTEIVDRWSQRDSRISYIITTKGSAAGSRNIGAKYANGNYLLFQDADCVADPCLLNNAWCWLNDIQINGVDISGVATKTTNTKPKTWVQRAVATQRAARWENSTVNLIKELDEKSGINVAIMKRDVFQKLGGFNESIFYFEDNDLTQRFFKSGYKAIFAKDVIQYHNDPLSLTESIGQCKSIAKGMHTKIKAGTPLSVGDIISLVGGPINLIIPIPFFAVWLRWYIDTGDLWGSMYFSTLWNTRSLAKLYYFLTEKV